MTYNWNGVIDFLREQIKDCNQREEQWKHEKVIYQNKIQELALELEQQKAINQQLMERLEAIKFVFQPITENKKKSSKNVKIGHQRVKSDLDYRNMANFNSVQPLINQQSIKREKNPLLSKYISDQINFSFLKDLEEDDDLSSRSRISKALPIPTQLNIQIQPNSMKKGQHILINQTNYTTFNQQTQPQQNIIKPKQPQSHHHQRSNSDGAQGNFLAQMSRFDQTQNDVSQQSIITNINTDRNMVIGKNLLEVQGILRGHLDGIRSITLMDQYILSASEDCTLKLWDTEHLKFQSDHLNIEPLTTIRCIESFQSEAHVGQVFSVTAQHQNYLSNTRRYLTFYSGGRDGMIRQTSIPEDGLSFDSITRGDISTQWEAHQDVIWSLKHHPTDYRLLSLSSDGSVKMWKTYEKLQYSDSIYKNPLSCYTHKRSINGLSVPCAMEWLVGKPQAEKIVCGYTDLTMLLFYDVETAKVSQQVKFFSQDFNSTKLQPNTIMSKPSQNYIISGHEDCTIRFFDQNSGKTIKNLVAHADSVTDLTNLPQSQNLIASVSHDGSMRTWDVRTFQCLHEQTIHKNKYDESIHTIAANNLFVATGGADGLIKVFKQSIF